MGRVGKNRQNNTATSIDMTPLLDTAFILIFFFLGCVLFLSVKVVSAANENATSANAQANEASAQAQALEEEKSGLEEALAVCEGEKIALQGQIDELKNSSEGLVNVDHLRGYEEIEKTAILICVRMERQNDLRTVQVVVDDEPIGDEIKLSDDRIDPLTSQLYDSIDEYISKIGMEKVDSPKFVYISRDSAIVYNRDVSAVFNKLDDLKNKYKNLYVIK